MRQSFKAILASIIVLTLALMLKSNSSLAGDIILTHNKGSENSVFFIEGEPSLVINGFDISSYAHQFPIALDAVSISVDRPVPGAKVELVVYQDANGGSPVDATLVYRQAVSINQAGFNRIILANAAVVTEPVVWVGFYLPVGFRFNADNSGSSVFTYWAWSQGGSLNVESLSSAPVLGPSDGSEPVGIDMQGIARITAELRAPIYTELESDSMLGTQLIAQDEQDTSILQVYPYCGDLFYDPEDIAVTSESSFTIQCDVASEFVAPTEVVHPDGHFLDLQRAGHLFKLDAQISEEERVAGAVGTLPFPVTHCISIRPEDLESAVIAEARGIPERWHVLPSVRFGDLVCAEITQASYLSYFLPRSESSPSNVNLVLGWSKVDPHPIECGVPTFIEIPAINTGQSWFSTDSGYVKFIVEDIHVRTGTVTGAIEIQIETSQLGPGRRHLVVLGPLYVTTYVHELHRLQVRVDFDEQVEETNEDDNIWFTEYILNDAAGSSRCFQTSWLTATPDPATVSDFCFVSQPQYRGEDQIRITYSSACEIGEFRSGSVPQRENIEFEVRGCRMWVQVKVVGQKVTVLYRRGDDPGCKWRHYRQTVERDGDKIHRLIIDNDGGRIAPEATPEATDER